MDVGNGFCNGCNGWMSATDFVTDVTDGWKKAIKDLRSGKKKEEGCMAVLKNMRYALCPMPYSPCPMPYARHTSLFEKGYSYSLYIV